MKIKYLLSPHFLEKSKILESIIFGIANNKIDLKSKIILDVGCGSEPYRQLFESRGAKYFGIDFKNYSKNNSFKIKKPDYYFSKTYSKNFKINNLSNNQFDIITSFQVLEHHERPDLFFKEANRLLKDKGYIIITFPFVWPLHEEPIDYHRLS